jgi:hypothetical protein
MTDLRGNPIGTASPAALLAAEQALQRIMSFSATPLAELDAAIAADPHWLLPRLMQAGLLLGLADAAQVPQAALLLAEAAACEHGAPARECQHLAALHEVLAGRWQHAGRLWDALLIEHPRDALALHWSHAWDFHCGDAAALRGRAARALPEWDEDDPLFAQVLGLHAFGLEACNLHPQAEEAGRRALAADPRSPRAVHAVAHAMEMQGRFDDGAAWLRQHQPQWADGNGFSTHLWWHLGLFRLEGLDHAGVLRLVDAHLSGDALQTPLQRQDAASLLWRLRLLGVDVGARWSALLAAWPLHDTEAGYHAFNDVHVLIVLLGADEPARAEAWLARCAERALSADDARRSNHLMAREAGLPLMRALLAFARGDAEAATGLYGVRCHAHRLGGSPAQRDLIDLTLLAACADGGPQALGRALLHERLLAKPATPLTRHWIAPLGLSERAARRLA